LCLECHRRAWRCALSAMSEPQAWCVEVGEASTSVRSEPSLAPVEPKPGPGEGEPVLVLAHGAGSHMEHETILSLAGAARGAGLGVVRFDFPYRAEGRGAPDRMPKLKACYEAVIASVRSRLNPARLLMGGQSMGGRVASLVASEGLACDGLILLAYPLHPAGKPEQLRDAHLAGIGVPTLCVNGTRDALCQQALMEQVVAQLPPIFTMRWLEGADHGYRVLKRSGRSREEVFAEIGTVLGRWVAGQCGPPG